MKKLLPSFLFILVAGVFLTVFAQSEGLEKPRLIDFGASLRPGYVKPKSTIGEPQNAPKSDDEIIRVDTDLVVSDVLVVTEKGFAVNNLTKADFIISEDGAAQTAETFAQGDSAEIGRSIVLVMDYSGSLHPYIKTSVAAAKVLVGKLNPKDKMAIVTDDVELISDFTRDKNLLTAKLDQLESRASDKKFGRSKQFSARMQVLQME